MTLFLSRAFRLATLAGCGGSTGYPRVGCCIIPEAFFLPPLLLIAPDIRLCSKVVVDTEDDTEFSDCDVVEEEGVVMVLFAFEFLLFMLSVIILSTDDDGFGAIAFW